MTHKEYCFSTQILQHNIILNKYKNTNISDELSYLKIEATAHLKSYTKFPILCSKEFHLPTKRIYFKASFFSFSSSFFLLPSNCSCHGFSFLMSSATIWVMILKKYKKNTKTAKEKKRKKVIWVLSILLKCFILSSPFYQPV